MALMASNKVSFQDIKEGIFSQMGLGVIILVLTLFFLNFIEGYMGQVQILATGWGLLAVIVLLFRKPLIHDNPVWRLLFLFLGAFISLRYILWRTTDTLQYTGPADFVAMTILYLAECYAIMIHMMGLFINASPLEHRVIPLSGDSRGYPTVDIFIPTYTESEDLVKATATAAKQIDYPADKLNIYIINDGSTVARRNNIATSAEAWQRHYTLRKIAERVGVHYLTREENNHAKAGNINAALGHTNGELVLILDCDHVPTRDILKMTVGRFLADPKLFLVQAPHFFINPTPVEKNVTNVGSVSSENDMFFRTMHLGFDSWNASYFCGSAALLRRKCLDEVGGVSGETITEDAETSLKLHAKGYNSVYINRPMVCGLQPETFNDYVTQRIRWAQGMIQIFIMHNPLTIKGLSWPQRIAYFNSCVFWFFGMPRMVYFLAPALFLMFGLKVYHATMIPIMAYAIPHLLSTFFIMDFLYGRSRKPLFSEIYETVQALFLIPAVLSVIIHPRKPTFKITPKGQTNLSESLNPLAIPFIAIIFINVFALSEAVYKWINFPIYRDVIAVTGAWCLYNSFLVIISMGAFWERKQVRYYHRISASGKVNAFFPRMDYRCTGELRDVSLAGLGFDAELPWEPKPNEEVHLTVSSSDGKVFEFEATVPRAFKRGNKYFLGSLLPLNYETFSKTVGFVYGDSERWVEYWKKTSLPGNSFKLVSAFFLLGIKAILEILLVSVKIFFVKIKETALKLRAQDMVNSESGKTTESV